MNCTTLQTFKDWLIINTESTETSNNYFIQVRKLLNEVGEPLNQEKINDYFKKLVESKSSPSTLNGVLYALKKYLEFTKEVFELPTHKGVDKRVNKYFTMEELTKEIIPFLGNICPKNYTKIEIIFKFLFQTGIRREELLTLKRSQINLTQRNIELIDTKGNKDRLVPFGVKLAENLKDYFSKHDETHNAFDVTKDELIYVFQKINKELNFKHQVTCKLFRHSCGVHLLKCGFNLLEIQQILGHSDIKTTQIYAEPDFNIIKEGYDKKQKEF